MSEKTVSENTAKEYLESLGNPPMSRIEYLFFLKEAHEEGMLMRAMNSAIETKEQWMQVEHWSRFAPALREEFYIAYRSGYVNYKADANA